ncbi:tripartite tricarboxylate transporter substrate binding protein [Zeimonas arvi]|uniref:Tripartite tricarboxylate transporter substrate binding protein n=1 Tax=Zeimonas arvi TaxID=2498847 RepID=A0A5C8NPZ5_9BURK|nr:tripartite tricarboxylate transporter substrate binding protein [Zeimonas arvi]TXL63864.1 tripartite tricarboxylate transporter substrate binding protein [Zeimonas arvi]
MKTRVVAAAAAIASTAALLAPAPAALAADAWPAKAVRIVAPFPPGGSVDQVSRLLAQHLAEPLKQSVVVENKSGASGSIGAAAVASAAPDGYTWLVVFDTHGVNPSVIPNMPFDTKKDLAPVMLIGTSPMALVAHTSQPWKNFADVLAEAKKKPGELAFGSIGSGSLGHLAMAQVGNMVGTSFNHIPYRGGGPLMTDAVGNQVPMAIGTVFLVTPHVQAGRVKPLAVTSAKAAPSLPGTLPMAEQGVPGFEALAWWGLLAPAGTPKPIVDRMHAEVSKVLAKAEVKEKLSSQGMDIVASSPADFEKFLNNEIDRWAKVVKDNDIQAGK